MSAIFAAPLMDTDAASRRRPTLTSYVAPCHVSTPTGRLIFPLSAPTPSHVALRASKEGLRQLEKALASEWGEDGIHVNSVAPGTI